MRVERPKPKIKESILIPNDFILFLKEVQREIDAGDEIAFIESDDLLQYEDFDFAYGGLTNENKKEYGFRYFTDDENGSTWDISLSSVQIKKIIKGEIKELFLWSCQHPLCGCKFSNEDDSCSNCDWSEE